LSYTRNALEENGFSKVSESFLEGILQLPTDPLRDCHNDLALVNVRAIDAVDLIRRPAHQISDFLIRQWSATPGGLQIEP